MRFSRLVALLALPLAMGGCASFPGSTGYLDELKATTPSGTAFTQALSQEYKAFAEAERLQYDWMSSQYFAKKGLLSSRGEAVPPEAVEGWSLGDAKAEIVGQRERLMRVLESPYATQRLPVLTATAQVKFDCWVEQQDEAWQDNDIAACRDDFLAAVEAIESQANIVPAAPQDSLQLFFDFNDARLSAEGRKDVQAAARQIREAGYPAVTLIGHTDSVGASAYNIRLSERRAEAVRKGLIAAGVPAEKIEIIARGKSSPLVATAENVREPQNRRVEIQLGK